MIIIDLICLLVLYAIQEVLRVCANLNRQNQEKIAAYLLQQLKNPSLFVSEFVLQLMVRIQFWFSFSSQPFTHICFLPFSFCSIVKPNQIQY
jgi:hypothetical protein